MNTDSIKELELKNFEDNITSILDGIKELLISKNRKYGNSAISPSRIFSKLDNISTILVRIDDKLTRIKNIGFDINSDNEDTINDLIGYLVILKYAILLKNKEEFIGVDVSNEKDYDTITYRCKDFSTVIPVDSSITKEQIEEFQILANKFFNRID